VEAVQQAKTSFLRRKALASLFHDGKEVSLAKMGIWSEGDIERMEMNPDSTLCVCVVGRREREREKTRASTTKHPVDGTEA
jgi:hypothetical protein